MIEEASCLALYVARCLFFHSVPSVIKDSDKGKKPGQKCRYWRLYSGLGPRSGRVLVDTSDRESSASGHHQFAEIVYDRLI